MLRWTTARLEKRYEEMKRETRELKGERIQIDGAMWREEENNVTSHIALYPFLSSSTLPIQRHPFLFQNSLPCDLSSHCLLLSYLHLLSSGRPLCIVSDSSTSLEPVCCSTVCYNTIAACNVWAASFRVYCKTMCMRTAESCCTIQPTLTLQKCITQVTYPLSFPNEMN